MLISFIICKLRNVSLRACLNFPIKKYYQVIFAFSSGLFSRFLSSDTRYHPSKNRKISSKETLKSDPSKIETGSKTLLNCFVGKFRSFIDVCYPLKCGL